MGANQTALPALVARLEARLDEVSEYLNAASNCPCCERTDFCGEECTLITDDPQGHEEIERAREALVSSNLCSTHVELLLAELKRLQEENERLQSEAETAHAARRFASDKCAEEIGTLRSEIEEWKTASGLEVGGCPHDVKPKHLEVEVANLRSANERLKSENEQLNHSKILVPEATPELIEKAREIRENRTSEMDALRSANERMRAALVIVSDIVGTYPDDWPDSNYCEIPIGDLRRAAEAVRDE